MRRMPFATDIGVKRIPVASAQLLQSGFRLRGFRLSGEQDNAPVRRFELYAVSEWVGSNVRLRVCDMRI